MKVRLFAVVAIVAILAAGAYSVRALADEGSGGGWLHESGGAWDAERALVTGFDSGRPNVVIVVDAVEGTVDSRPVVRAATELTTALESRRDLAQVESYWSLGRPEWLRSEDGRSGLILTRIPGDSAEFSERSRALAASLRTTDDAIEVRIGGEAMVHHDVASAMRSLGLPMALAALLSVFLVLIFTRSLLATTLVTVAAALATASTAVAGRFLAGIVEVPLLSVVLALAVAWGLAVSGGYLMVRRFVSEQAAGADARQATAATVGTAGRSVAGGVAVTFAASVGLWLMPTALLRSSGYAIGLGALAAGIAAVLVLGAMLAVAGERLSGRRGAVDAHPAVPIPDPVSAAALRRPVLAAVGATVVLGAMLVGSYLQTPLGATGPETLAYDASSRRVSQELAASFTADEAGAPFVVARGIVVHRLVEEQATDYARDLSMIPGVVRTDAAQGSFVAGTAIETPRRVRTLYRGENGIWFKVPVTGGATGRTAEQVRSTIEQTTAPFRIQVGGLAARQHDTVGVVTGRIPAYLSLMLAVSALLLLWLLRSINAALRATSTIVLVAAVAGIVVWLGFADGKLSSLLGFVPTGTVDAVAPALAWTVAFAVAGVSMVYGWSAIREMNDATHGDERAAALALATTRGRHIEASALLTLPFAPLIVAGWRPAQLVGVVAVATGLAAVTVGRFVVLPAFASFAPTRLWPVDARGDQRRVYPVTLGTRRSIGIPVPAGAQRSSDAQLSSRGRLESGAPIASRGQAPTPGEPHSAAEPSSVTDEIAAPEPRAGQPGPVTEPGTVTPDRKAPRPDRVPAESKPAESRPAEADVDAAVVASIGASPPPEPSGSPPSAEVSPAEGSDSEEDPDESRRLAEHRLAERHLAQLELAERRMAEREAAERQSVEAAERQAVEAAKREAEAAEREAAQRRIAERETDGARTEPSPDRSVVEPVRQDSLTTAEGDDAGEDAVPVESGPVESGPVESGQVESGQVESGQVESGQVESVPVESGPPDEEADVAAGGAAPDPAVPRLQVAPAPSKPETARAAAIAAGTVDVVMLTESVIASIDPETPFTTEIGTGFVANPSNNLSRVMEAILRDASQRGGEEVLVYGHASRGRYRWMVVDSGPRADDDPDRARTLAEAQRFIRRVGGVVECRPEGDFTVFVVEIPMAS